MHSLRREVFIVVLLSCCSHPFHSGFLQHVNSLPTVLTINTNTNHANPHSLCSNNAVWWFSRSKSSSSTSCKSYLQPESEGKPTPLPKLQYQTPPPKAETKPILVLGATGRIGRLVVQKLLQLNLPVRAFVRDYDLACDIFRKYVDSSSEKGSMSVVRQKGQTATASLQIVVGDLAPEDAHPDEDYDVGYEALETALKGCDTIISCAGTIRSSNWKTDFVPPWRIYETDVTNYNVQDRRHPYFVYYIATKKLVDLVKRELDMREKIEEDNADSSKFQSANTNTCSNGMAIVRISDLSLSFPPWGLVTILTNLLRSMTFRYQEMADQVLSQSSSSKLRTVILRPGDLTDEDRDPEKVSLQISPTGRLPSPSMVGRSDVAALAVATAIASQNQNDNDNPVPSTQTLAVRWVGEDLSPQAQGRKQDGYKDAKTCVKMLSKNTPPGETRSLHRRRSGVQPYGVYVGLVLYSCLAIVVNAFVRIMCSNNMVRGWVSSTVAPFAASAWRGLIQGLQKGIVRMKSSGIPSSTSMADLYT